MTMVWRSTWTPAEDAVLITRRAEGAHHHAIAASLGRTQASAYSRLQYHGAITVAGAQRVLRDKAVGQRHVTAHTRGHVAVDPRVCPLIPAAPGDGRRPTVTALVCGDPPPGRSALDRRQAADKTALPFVSAQR